MRIDLNADLGEGFGPWTMGDDDALLSLVSSANVACGFHAGDPVIMARTVRIAAERGVDIGAHVGFPDRQGFGRRQMQVPVGELAAIVTYQLGALAGIARAAGHAMTHMSFHGALGNMAAADPAMAGPLVEAVARFDDSLTLSSSPSRAIEEAAAHCGLRVATTFLADRACDRDGLLVPRGKPGAVIHDEASVLARVGAAAGRGRRRDLRRCADPGDAREHPAARRYPRGGGARQVPAKAGRGGRGRGHAHFANAQEMSAPT